LLVPHPPIIAVAGDANDEQSLNVPVEAMNSGRPAGGPRYAFGTFVR